MKTLDKWFSNGNFFLTSSNIYLNIYEKSLTSVFIFCFKENWEKVPFLKVLDKETPLIKSDSSPNPCIIFLF